MSRMTKEFRECLIQWINEQCYDVVCVSIGDDDYEWRVIAHHMGDPKERCYGFGDTAKEAICMAIAHVDEYGDYAPDIWSVIEQDHSPPTQNVETTEHKRVCLVQRTS